MQRIVAVLVLLVVSAVGCGRYEPPGQSEAGAESNLSREFGMTRCLDVPRLPPTREVSRALSGDGTVTLSWWSDSSQTEFVEYTVRIDDPTCAERPDIRYWFGIHAEPPRFENARIVVRPGEDRAYIGYTIIGKGENQYASPERIRAVGEDGRAVEWKHQTATGGPADVVAVEGRSVVAPGAGDSGDADYVDASAVRVGETVTVTFPFETGPVEVPFRVVASD